MNNDGRWIKSMLANFNCNFNFNVEAFHSFYWVLFNHHEHRRERLLHGEKKK